jgi:hypothetical protein
MASPTLKELQFRKFDDLLNEVYIDFPSYSREGMVEPGQLIKIAQRCNYELGLKIHGTKETMLEVEHGRAKLPSDFYILNLALLCGHYRVCEPGLFNGIHSENVVVPIPAPQSPYLTTCPCWTVVSLGSQCPVQYCDGTQASVFFPANDDGSAKTTKICATLVDVANAHGAGITATTNSFCYNYQSIGYSCDAPDVCCVPSAPGDTCDVVNPDPWHQNRVFTQCNGTMQVNVIEYHSNEIREYSQFEKIHMVSSKEATAFCVNTQFQNAPHQGNIRDGFLWIPTMRDNDHFRSNRKVYICYLGAMEDAQGNLIVLDHPLINNFYEYALKLRIMENIYLNGEPDVERRLEFLKKEYKEARALALGLVTTPDWYEFKKTIEMNRKAMYHKYLDPFSSIFANTPGWPWAENTRRL